MISKQTVFIFGMVGALIGILLFRRPIEVTGNVQINGSYDYIIVGAGSAGCVLANRLSEDGASSVLLLEAGGSEAGNPDISTPIYATKLQKTEYDWAYVSKSQTNAFKALRDQRAPLPRGKVLGGSSILNYMDYSRGSPHDYNEWSADGCKGWSFEEVLPYFLKSEDIQIPELENSKYHSKGGPLSVSDVRQTPMSQLFKQAADDLGLGSSGYCNGESQTGYCSTQSTIRKGERSSTASAFLRPAMKRSNLHVSINSHVVKIILEQKRAAGVEFIRDNRKYRVLARKEVIVSAGSINSPQILMLSGIGPKQHLQSLGITVHADLPVGKGMQDHLYLPLTFISNVSYSLTPDKVESWSSRVMYTLFGTGPRSTFGAEGMIFHKSNVNSKTTKSPDAHIIMVVNGMQHPENIMFLNNYNSEVVSKMFEIDLQPGQGLYMLIPFTFHTKSRGSVQLRSSDPFDPPNIDLNMLDHTDDVRIMIEALRVSIQLVNTTSLKAIGSSADDPYRILPMCKEHAYATDAYWECIVRYMCSVAFHQSSTCRMGGKSDPTAVVDEELKVIGISGLRVVDASVMRNLPSSNINAPVIMIAEKAADMIRGIDSVDKFR